MAALLSQCRSLVDLRLRGGCRRARPTCPPSSGGCCSWPLSTRVSSEVAIMRNEVKTLIRVRRKGAAVCNRYDSRSGRRLNSVEIGYYETISASNNILFIIIYIMLLHSKSSDKTESIQEEDCHVAQSCPPIGSYTPLRCSTLTRSFSLHLRNSDSWWYVSRVGVSSHFTKEWFLSTRTNAT